MRKEELEFEPFDDVRHAKAMDELVEYVQGVFFWHVSS